MGRHILFKCANTGLSVQHWLEDAADGTPESDYQSVVCPACTRLHFIHRETGKLVGED